MYDTITSTRGGERWGRATRGPMHIDQHIELFDRYAPNRSAGLVTHDAEVKHSACDRRERLNDLREVSMLAEEHYQTAVID